MSMTVKEIADRLVELVNQGKNLQAEEELYAQDIASYEQDASRNAKGLENVMAKTRMAFESFEGGSITARPAMINNDSFLVLFDADATFKGGGAMKGVEYGFYKVKDGKITEEYFYF